MQAVLLLLALVHIVGVLIVFFAAAKAPYGHEDDAGFHPRKD
jgi:hypothetical protein